MPQSKGGRKPRWKTYTVYDDFGVIVQGLFNGPPDVLGFAKERAVLWRRFVRVTNGATTWTVSPKQEIAREKFGEGGGPLVVGPGY